MGVGLVHSISQVIGLGRGPEGKCILYSAGWIKRLSWEENILR